jgi:response regulator RpfG family c-di-GMP phosphodiesterase
MMITQFGDFAPLNTEDALVRVPARSFGETDWVTLALNNCAAYLEPAIASGKPYRIAQALRTIAHAPSAEQIDDIVRAACDTLLADAYAHRNSRNVSKVADARAVIQTLLTEMRAAAERSTLEPAQLRETVDGYVAMIALHDKRLAARLDAVGALAARIAATMHLSHADVLDAEFGGRLHDVGMVAMPRDRGQKTHSVTGDTFVRSISALAHLAPIVRSHHEAWNGSGFPDGLAGEEIPLVARIVSVAGTFIDLVSDTSRHKAMAPDEACREIAHHAGTKFDPAVVSATLHLLRYRQRTSRSA